ncbi:MAG: LuxR family transcriptional regulator [Paracoccus denitrificans]|nr:MAG: LuxR family transcriptional regulator [Paracoccus denitrificans]PZO84616.1 MAG: LuxR family transcriptional regulator [Paracoccus denitrificans]
MSDTAPALVDSHCHLDFPDFDGQHDELIARARAQGVTRMVTICTRLGKEPAVRALADRFDEVFYAAGVHPMYAAEEPLTRVDQLVALADHPKFVGIGETGLDYHYSADSAAIQAESLRVHIEAARQTGLPLIIHSRDADADMARILSEEHAAGPFSCVMHCYTSGPELAEAALSLGFYLSMSGITAFPKSTDIRAIFAAAPRDRILVETDAPYLAPPPYRGKRNEPSYVAKTAARAAELFEMTPAEFAALTSANFDRLFTKAHA